MKTMKKRKWYSPQGMARAVRVQAVMRGPLSAIAVLNGEIVYIGTTEGGCAMTLRGKGIPKDLAKLTASVPEHRLYLLFGVHEDGARDFMRQMGQQLGYSK
jgi:hypothetical protein